ncbi:pentatricopeptide repeat-containing protein At1g79540 [Benincasa hispida]|uniref:pentatricopeptide repeat-containing protein At1g79540 n=1 Tax=Benincasa hispida TaxID=102211 RepID=UPI0019014671|nr:pentatricopeptide repeat-containing protein At1g79540 [Benincasa hispida]XP_038901214.1 pentatricopeptide repeat-containing protein At1g79540 [Benincasa hispida]XP_038901215.1 pentatricopeptide repeat-containing protein At1g79540 [Benincasa hispida]
MKVRPLCFRPIITYVVPKPPWFQSFHSPTDPIATSNEVSTIIETVDSFEDGLEVISPHISSDIITSVIQEQPNPRLGFRLFIWSLRRKRLCCSASQNLIIDRLVKDNAFELYWKTLQELKDSAIEISSDAFSVLIEAYLKAGMEEKAVESFGLMRDFDCKPNVFAFNLILHLLVRKEAFLLALAVYNQMLKCNLNPNVVTYGILIHGFCKTSKTQTQDALALFDEMTDRGILPNEITYSIVLSGLCRAKKIHDAQRLFSKMRASGFSPDVVTYNVLLNGFCKLGYLNEAFALLQSFEKDGHILGVNGYSCLINGLFRARRYDEAHMWYQKLLRENIKPDVILYTIMIQGLSQEGRVTDALALLGEMTERGFSPDTACYNVLIKGFCDLGYLDKAQSLRLEISNHNCFPDNHTYSILICGMCKNGLVSEAQRVFNEMEKLGCIPSVVTFNSLIDGLCKAGRLEEAHLLFCKMEIGRKPSLFLRLSQGTNKVLDTASLQVMMEQLCESGLVLKAYKLLMQLVESGVLPDIRTYNILINGFCKNNNINGAFKLVKEMELKGRLPDSVTYGTLIDGLYRVGRDEDALGIFEQMVKKGCKPDSSIYKSIMTWLCRKKNISLAFNVWMKYLRNFRGWEDEKVKIVVESFDKGELKTTIWRLLKMDMESKDFDLAPYTIFLIGLCQAKRVSEAFAIFSVLKDFKMNISSASCVMLIGRLCVVEKLDLAVDVFLYTLEEGLMLMPRICNRLLSHLLHVEDKKDHALVLLNKMEAFGYDMNTHLHYSTKLLLRDHWESLQAKAFMPKYMQLLSTHNQESPK